MSELKLATSVSGRPGESVLISVDVYILYYYANTTCEPTQDKQQHSYQTTISEINDSQYLCSATFQSVNMLLRPLMDPMTYRKCHLPAFWSASKPEVGDTA